MYEVMSVDFWDERVLVNFEKNESVITSDRNEGAKLPPEARELD